MKSVFIFLLAILAVYNNDPFYEAVKGLERINYFIKNPNGCKAKNNSTKCCTLNSTDDCLVKELQGKDKNFDLSKINLIREFFVKSSIDMGGNVYARANIREYTCNTIQDAEKMEEVIKNAPINDLSPCTNKSPFNWFRKEDKIYFIIIGGHYMIDELPKIEKQFRGKLRH